MDMERVHVNFLRRLLGVPQSSPVQMIYIYMLSYTINSDPQLAHAMRQ